MMLFDYFMDGNSELSDHYIIYHFTEAVLHKPSENHHDDLVAKAENFTSLAATPQRPLLRHAD